MEKQPLEQVLETLKSATDWAYKTTKREFGAGFINKIKNVKSYSTIIDGVKYTLEKIVMPGNAYETNLTDIDIHLCTRRLFKYYRLKVYDLKLRKHLVVLPLPSHLLKVSEGMDKVEAFYEQIEKEYQKN